MTAAAYNHCMKQWISQPTYLDAVRTPFYEVRPHAGSCYEVGMAARLDPLVQPLEASPVFRVLRIRLVRKSEIACFRSCWQISPSILQTTTSSIKPSRSNVSINKMDKAGTCAFQQQKQNTPSSSLPFSIQLKYIESTAQHLLSFLNNCDKNLLFWTTALDIVYIRGTQFFRGRTGWGIWEKPAGWRRSVGMYISQLFE